MPNLLKTKDDKLFFKIQKVNEYILHINDQYQKH